MNINVQVLCEECRKCPNLRIETTDLWAEDRIYDKIFSCENLKECIVVAEILEKQNESNHSG